METTLDTPEVCHEAFEKAVTSFKHEFPGRPVSPDVRDRIMTAVLDLHRAGQKDVERLVRYAVTRARSETR